MIKFNRQQEGGATKMDFKKKAQAVTLANLPSIVALLVVGILIATFASDIVDDINGDQTANSAAANVSSNGLTGMLNLSGQFGNIGTVIGAGLIIGILVAAFAFSRLGGR